MSKAVQDAIAAAKRRLLEEERQRKEREAWRASPAGKHGHDFGARIGPWILDLARALAADQARPVAALQVTRGAVNRDDVFEWPCGHGTFEAMLHRFPAGGAARTLASTPFLVGCRCPPLDAWALVVGPKADQEGLLSYGILPDSGQFWFSPADLGPPDQAVHYFDGSRTHEQIAPGELVVQVCAVTDTSADPAAPPDPCGLGSFTLTPSTNFVFPLRAAEQAFRATLEGFFAGADLPPQILLVKAGG